MNDVLEKFAVLANKLDTKGLIDEANEIDNLISMIVEAGIRAPKYWFDERMADVKKQYPDYNKERLMEIVGGIWNKLSKKEQEKIRREHGPRGHK